MYNRLDAFLWRDANSLLGQLKLPSQMRFAHHCHPYAWKMMPLSTQSWEQGADSRRLCLQSSGTATFGLTPTCPALSGQLLPLGTCRKVARQLLSLHSTFSSDRGDVQGTGSSTFCSSGHWETPACRAGWHGYLPVSPHKASLCYRVIRETKVQVPLFKKKGTNKQNCLQKLLLSSKRNIINIPFMSH